MEWLRCQEADAHFDVKTEVKLQFQAFSESATGQENWLTVKDEELLYRQLQLQHRRKVERVKERRLDVLQ